MNTPLAIDESSLEGFCARNHIQRLSLFGSHQKGTARSDSDIDILVEFEPARQPGLLGLAKMAMELTVLAGGRRVDLRTPQDLSRHFRDEIVNNAEVVFAR
jgi:predicted nucleotidyltransferase